MSEALAEWAERRQALYAESRRQWCEAIGWPYPERPEPDPITQQQPGG